MSARITLKHICSPTSQLLMSLGLGWGLRIRIPTSSKVTVVVLLVRGPVENR